MHGAATGARGRGGRGVNVVSTEYFHRGDVTRGFAEADVVVERRYTTPMVHQGDLQPRAVLAAVDPLRALTVWTSTQAPSSRARRLRGAGPGQDHQVKVVAMLLGWCIRRELALL